MSGETTTRDPRTETEAAPPNAGWLAGVVRKAVLGKLEELRHGELRLWEGGVEKRFGKVSPDGLQATLRVHDPAFYSRVAFGGSVAAGEAFMDGQWSTDDLCAVVRLLVRNREVLDGLETGWARLASPALQLFHRLRANTRKGSRRNIGAHYDLSNDFFRLFLDETLMYSAAVFERPEMTLAEASRAKIERLCRKLDLGPEDHVLEIGTGWGAFAVHAARHHGCRVTTTTISEKQYKVAAERVRAAGLEDRITLLRQDYRDLQGRFDKLVSIEMIEAVGRRFLDTFFQVASERLHPHGAMALQAITIADRFYEQASRSVDFIQRYIFPGGFIPSVGALTDSTVRVTDLTLVGLEDIGLHYARTLREWRHNLFENVEEVRRLGFSERFLRMWEFYFCYCEGGFLERSISDVQMVFAKPDCRSPAILGPPA